MSKNKSSKVRWGICVLAAIIMLGAGFRSICIYLDYKTGEDLYRDANEDYVRQNDGTAFSSGNIADAEDDLPGEEDDLVDWREMVFVDLESIQKVNQDVVGWLYFENEDISYPILYAKESNEYLKTSYDKKHLSAGSIFMENCNSRDFMDEHTMIYGHNMKDLSMFGKLKYYRQDAGYYENHKYFQIITNDSVYRYMIFAYKEVDDDSDVYTTSFDDTNSFMEFVKNEIVKDSLLNSGMKIAPDDRILTLSTCTKGDRRFVVSALMIDKQTR